MTFTRAIVRTPGDNFADGLTSVALGTPNLERALEQHQRYCEALTECGLNVTSLPADLEYPDSTFVEDTAVLVPERAILTRPGASSRMGEVTSMHATLARIYPALFRIEEPGTLDGGDICEAGRHFFIGVSQRTNEEGARQLASFLRAAGYASTVIDIRGMSSILHLKSGVSFIGDNTMVVIEELASLFPSYERIQVSEAESYAANCVCVNGRVLVPDGFPVLTAELDRRGLNPLPLDMSEFRKMDGGLSCLSLRF